MEAQKEGFRQVAMVSETIVYFLTTPPPVQVALCYVEMYLDVLKGKRRSQLTDTAAGR